MIIPLRHRAFVAAVAVAASVVGIIVAIHYARLDLTLSHYDARGHLIVARRIFDSLTPGWRQIGAIWLPLPHLLNAVPVQVDAWYRSGASAVAISIASFAVACAALASLILALTGSRLAAAAGVLVFALNPNVLYLQATPMTEPLLLALLLAGLAALAGLDRAWRCGSGGAGWIVGLLFALACLSRYEAWPVTAGAVAVAAWTLWRQGAPIDAAARRVYTIALAPAAAIVGFMVFSKIVIGSWFVSSGFFVPENRALGRPLLAALEIGWGIRSLSGWIVLGAGAVGVMAAGVRGVLFKDRAAELIVLALVGAEAVAWAAFYQGHPFRVRYMVPLIAAEALGVGLAAALLRPGRWRAVAAILLSAAAFYDLRPLDPTAPMVLEAQWDRPNSAARRDVTACLAEAYRGETILASMGSLGHYMQETAAAGFDLTDFLHEGNHPTWDAALKDPLPYVGWILVEERAEGGDMLARRARENPRFLHGFSRVCEGGGVALYRRQNRTLKTTRYDIPPRSMVGPAKPRSDGRSPSAF